MSKRKNTGIGAMSGSGLQSSGVGRRGWPAAGVAPYSNMAFSSSRRAAQNMTARLTLAEAATQPMPTILSSIVRTQELLILWWE